jgi:acyl-CoA synthetase (AMP-forming)/AMP-acid ligase II
MWVWDLVERRAAETPDALCALDESGRALSFGELRSRGERVAAALVERDVAPGSAVCWQLPTWLESLVLTVALSRAGAVQVPLLPILRERELSVAMRQVRPSVVLCPSTWRGFDYAEMWDRLGRSTAAGAAPQVITCDRSLPESVHTGVLPSRDHAAPAPGQHRWVFFSSGTTGVPKGARHTDESVTAGPVAFCERVGLRGDDRYPIIFPFTHVGGIGTLFAQLLTGASAVLDEQFEPQRTIELMAASDITIGAGGTPLVQLYLDHQRRTPERRLFPRLRICLTGAAPKPPTMHAAVQRELGGRGCMSTYGLTEAPFLTISALDDSDADLATTEGRPAAGAEVRVVSLDGRVCGPGEEGELRARGPQLFLGYLDDSLDADAFDDDGFFRTGDLGRVDERGNVTISGRIKEIIIRKGENISALEVEHVLATHPAIADVAVIGLPDPDTGERCCAVVVLDGAESLTLDDVRTFAESNGLARQKVPEQLEIVDTLPRNAAGKIVKHELRAAVIASHGPQADVNGG